MDQTSLRTEQRTCSLFVAHWFCGGHCGHNSQWCSFNDSSVLSFFICVDSFKIERDSLAFLPPGVNNLHNVVLTTSQSKFFFVSQQMCSLPILCPLNSRFIQFLYHFLKHESMLPFLLVWDPSDSFWFIDRLDGFLVTSVTTNVLSFSHLSMQLLAFFHVMHISSGSTTCISLWKLVHVFERHCCLFLSSGLSALATAKWLQNKMFVRCNVHHAWCSPSWTKPQPNKRWQMCWKQNLSMIVLGNLFNSFRRPSLRFCPRSVAGSSCCECIASLSLRHKRW